VKVALVSVLKPGWVLEATVGENTFAILNVDGEIRAFEGSCPCTGGPLGKGAIREGLLVCPWHGWRFDCESGVSAYDANVCIRRVPVKVDGDEIWIEVP
jgi:nitrite reductase/ring-hydroxylating ferredoxin subunit